MKKILLSALAIISFATINAQIYVANDSTSFSVWTTMDLDGDGNNFVVSENINGMSAISYSYDNTVGPLTPDNLFISPAIDLSTGSNLMLNYTVTAIDQAWASEKYAVYVVTDLIAIASGNFPTAVQEEVLTTGVLTRNIDISAVADGQSTAYIVIRHYDCSDWFAIGFNDLSISGEFVSVEEEEETSTVLSVYPNPTSDILNITLSEEATSVHILTLDGKTVATTSVKSKVVSLDLADLPTGIYIYEVETKEGEKVRNTFVKK